MTDTPSHRRKYPRTRVSFDRDVSGDGAGSQRRTSGRLVVLSASDAFVGLDDAYPVDRPLDLRFEVSDVGTIGCRANVRGHLEDREGGR